jgi:hypothetical protein
VLSSGEDWIIHVSVLFFRPDSVEKKGMMRGVLDAATAVLRIAGGFSRLALLSR